MENLMNDLRKSQFWEYLTSDNTNIDKLISYTVTKNFETGEKIIFKEILEKLNKTYDIPDEYLSLRIFISSFIICKDPDTLLSKQRTDIEENLYNKSKEILEFISNLNEDYKLLGKKLLTHNILFNEWKAKDLESQLDILCEVYYRYKEQLDETPKEVINNSNKEIVNFIEKIKISMKRLTPNYKEYIDNYKLKKVSYDDKATNLIYKKLKQTYWKYIEDKIFEKKEYTIIDRIIADYCELIEDINVNDLDISSIKSYNGIYSLEALVSLANQMIVINKQIDSEHYDDIYAYITDKLIKSNNYLCDIYKFLFERLEFIKNVKDTLYEKD